MVRTRKVRRKCHYPKHNTHTHNIHNTLLSSLPPPNTHTHTHTHAHRNLSSRSLLTCIPSRWRKLPFSNMKRTVFNRLFKGVYRVLESVLGVYTVFNTVFNMVYIHV